ncbi:hypothetical protein F383_10905 [Gossypium arboreum]|uniref:Uncharacterized protein n=1 Tax=Gossypium arboreum TaxID=29729 RepID=A0A0B0NAU9_GOSAR|nr:hypothetical protein F383_10905 [Gossypium arboreum]
MAKQGIHTDLSTWPKTRPCARLWYTDFKS